MTEIEKPQPDFNDQTPGMPRWLIGALLGIAIYLIVGFVLVQFDNQLFEDWMLSPTSHCDDLRNMTQLKILSVLFRGFIIDFFLNPILGSMIHYRTFEYYFTGISIFAVGGAVLSNIKFTKILRLIIGIAIISAWIEVALLFAVVALLFNFLPCFL
jgi:hypothetical protein